MRKSWISDRSFRKNAQKQTNQQLNALQNRPSTSNSNPLIDQPSTSNAPDHEMQDEFGYEEPFVFFDEPNESDSSYTEADVNIDGYQDPVEFLREWSIFYKIRRDCLEDLLHFLHKTKHFPTLPVTKATLLRTPTEPPPIINVAPGEYIHIGLEYLARELHQKLDLKSKLAQNNILHCHMHIDGIAFANSSKLSGWTILVDCVEIPEMEPALIGVYSGYHSPNDFDEFMMHVCNDFQESFINGTETNSDYKVHFKLIVLAADAPARSKCTHTKGHAGYFACPFCSQKGSQVEFTGAMQYSDHIVYPLRNMTQYENREGANHFHKTHMSKSGALETIPQFDCVEGAPPDVMHNCDLGVTLKMLRSIFNGGNDFGAKISKDCWSAINSKYLETDEFKPVEFSRRPRDIIENISRLKATEGRHICLYHGSKIFRELPTDMYHHFLKYSLGIRLLSSSLVAPDAIITAEKLLTSFVRDYRKYYGYTVSYVVHMLLHLPHFAQLHGPLYTFSCYRFENKLASVKGDVRKKYQVAQQLYRRSKERGIVHLKREKYTGLRRPFAGGFREYHFNNMSFITDKKGDKYAKVSRNNETFAAHILFFYEEEGVAYFQYQRLSDLQHYFEIDLEGSTLYSGAFDIWKTDKETYVNNTSEVAPVINIIGKYVVFEDDGDLILTSFLHNIEDN